MNVNTEGFGLLASGSSGCWEVAIDESLGQAEAWIAEIDGPHICLSFQLRDIEVISEARAFLAQRPTKNSAGLNHYAQSCLVLGQFGQNPVSLAWDNEEFGRCFVIIFAQSHCVRVPLREADIKMLQEALSNVLSDFE